MLYLVNTLQHNYCFNCTTLLSLIINKVLNIKRFMVDFYVKKKKLSHILWLKSVKNLFFLCYLRVILFSSVLTIIVILLQILRYMHTYQFKPIGIHVVITKLERFFYYYYSYYESHKSSVLTFIISLYILSFWN